MPGSSLTRSPPSSLAEGSAPADAVCSEACGGTPASQPAEAAAASVCSGVRSVDGSPAPGRTAQRHSRRTGEERDQGSSCSSGLGGSTGLSNEPSAGWPPQSGRASAFSSILQRSGRDALALLTPESRQVAGGALPGRLGLWLGSQALACPTGLSPLAVLATPAALPSWLDRLALAAPCAGLTGQGLGLLQALSAPLSPLPTPAWLRATPPAETPQPGDTNADPAGSPPEPAALRLTWETPLAGAPARAGLSPPARTSAESKGSAACEPERGLRWLTQSPEGSAHCGVGASPSPSSPSFQDFCAPAVPSAQAPTQPCSHPASLSPSVAALATPQAPSSPKAGSTLNLSPNPRQGPARVPDTAEQRLVDCLHAQLEAGRGGPQAPGRAHGHAGAARAAAERRATFLRAIDRLQAR